MVSSMTTRAQTTSLQRTYRYLRIAVAGTVVVIFVAVAVTIPVVGVLPSLSHYSYTPAHTLFVGSLITVGVCLFALSGRGPERVLLDVAAILVPLVAIVPTVISPGSIAGVDVSCAGACVPDAYGAAVDVGVATYVIVGVLLLIGASALTVVGEVEREGGILSLSIAAAVLLIVWLTWWLARPVFLQWTHFVAAIGFFGVIAAVAVVNAFWPGRRRKPTPVMKAAYAIIAVALALDVIGLPLFGSQRIGPFYWVFAGEVIALLLFLAFWVIQSIQFWSAVDPDAVTGA